MYITAISTVEIFLTAGCWALRQQITSKCARALDGSSLHRKASEKPLTGHHVGLYGQIVTYDFELGGKGYLGDKWSYGGGVAYGYSLPVGHRFNVDFTLGIGYLGGLYKEYIPLDGHYVWQTTKKRRWFGPTKAGISLVWLIGRGNYSRKKGGRQ